MANFFTSTFKSIWHTMTSDDRHSEFDSPYRTGRHVPLNQSSRLDRLTTVATASESRADVNAYGDGGYGGEANNRPLSRLNSTTSYEGAGGSPIISGTPHRPYSPGLRSQFARTNSGNDGFETVQSPAGEIPMQSFQDGLPPPPPVQHSWKRIDAWTEENYPELSDQLCEGCTTNDINGMEHQLDCTLPQDVRDSLQTHDGQERGGRPTGIIFGSMLLDCEEIVQEWDQWRKVNHEFLLETSIPRTAAPSRAFGGSRSDEASSSKAAPRQQSPQNPAWRQDLLSRQESVPPNAIRKAYAHPAWIPLVRDWGGNNLAVDLAPGQQGTWGQIILFGRDYDTKFVVARSWAGFLALVADDLNSGKWFIDEETNELKLREFRSARVEPAYFDILRWRMDQKYGRRGQGGAGARRRPGSAQGGGTVSPTMPGSPYAGPSDGPPDARGRTAQRLSASSPLSSPSRPGYGKPSPLARVTEEAAAALSEQRAATNGSAKPAEKLVEVETPRLTSEENAPRLAALSRGESSELSGTTAYTDDSLATIKSSNGKLPDLGEDDENMKTIEI